ncbi:MAG: urease accessory protein UreD [Pseudoalteromonas distincta]
MSFTHSADGVTFLARQQVGYPFHVGRVLRRAADPGPMATVLLQSCSGGVFEGEDLGLEVSVGANAMVHLSTGASTIVHSMQKNSAHQRVSLQVGKNAILEYLPKPTILFSGAQFTNEVEVSLDEQASLILWDVCLSHGPDGNPERFGYYRNVIRVRDEHGHLKILDRMCIQGADLSEAKIGVNGGLGTFGTLFIVTRKVNSSVLIESMRNVMFEDAENYAGASELPGGIGVCVRVLAKSAAGITKQLENVLYCVRPLILDSLKTPCD